MSNETVRSFELPAARRAAKRPQRSPSTRGVRSNAGGRVLSAAAMRSELIAWRARADYGRVQFHLLVSGPLPQTARPAVERLIANAASDLVERVDACGWLVDGRLGILVSQRIGPLSSEDPPRSELPAAAERLLGSAIAEPVTTYEYPLPPAADALVGGRLWPQVEEGGVERYFVLATSRWKRLIDICASVVLLIVLAPLLAIVALAIKATSRGPAFYRQKRTGQGGRPFWMYKFRSMVEDADTQQAALKHLNVQDGPAFKIPRDPRVTKVGWWLRETCLDELPQLWNVLRGEMSLVGPRPLPCHESAACTGWRRRRLDILPGITCLWQARGRSTTSFDDWMRLDVIYAQRQSLRLDLMILLSTLPLLLPRARKITSRITRRRAVCAEKPTAHQCASTSMAHEQNGESQ